MSMSTPQTALKVGDLVQRSPAYAQYCVCRQQMSCWCREPGAAFEVRGIRPSNAQGGATVDVRHWGRMLWAVSVAWFEELKGEEYFFNLIRPLQVPLLKTPVRKKVPVRRG